MKLSNFLIMGLVITGFMSVYFLWLGQNAEIYGVPLDARTQNTSRIIESFYNSSNEFTSHQGANIEQGKVGDTSDQDSLARKATSSVRLIQEMPGQYNDLISNMADELGVPVWGGVLFTVLMIMIVVFFIVFFFRLPNGGQT